MTEPTGMSRRRALMYGGLAGAVPLLPAMRPEHIRSMMSPPTATKEESATSTFTVNIPAGPLWSNAQAQQLGPAIAAAHFGTFTGQWSTIIESQMSVVQVQLPAQPTGSTQYTMDVPAGPIWSDADAKTKCPAICASYGGTWNGQWRTVVTGKLSVAGCTFTF
jgi:hypothetical protein